MKIQKTHKFVIAFAFLLSAWACGGSNSSKPPAIADKAERTPSASSTAPQTVDDLAVGRQLYSAACAACHRENGAGGKITIERKSIDPDDLTSEKIKKMTDEKMIGYIYDGIEDEGMPSFKGKLTEAEIREIVRFVRIGIQKLPDETKPKNGR